MRHKFLVLTVKKLLKSVYIYGSYRKIKTGLSLFWTTLYTTGNRIVSMISIHGCSNYRLPFRARHGLPFGKSALGWQVTLCVLVWLQLWDDLFSRATSLGLYPFSLCVVWFRIREVAPPCNADSNSPSSIWISCSTGQPVWGTGRRRNMKASYYYRLPFIINGIRTKCHNIRWPQIWRYKEASTEELKPYLKPNWLSEETKCIS